MSNKRAPGRSLEEWMELVTVCRQSRLTDAAWVMSMGYLPAVFTMPLPVSAARIYLRVPSSLKCFFKAFSVG